MRATWLAAAMLALSGLALGWNKGQLPHRASPSTDAAGNAELAADLALYRDIITAVRRGENYYGVAREKIPEYGFPIGSPLNWRLPTYAWLFSRLPGEFWIRLLLVVLSVVALAL